MPKTVATRPGEVKETVIQERIVPVDETNASPAAGLDAFEYMERLSEADWTDHVVYLYRKFPPPPDGASRTYIAKFSHAFDEEWIRDKADVIIGGVTVARGFGGGTYHYILKKGPHRLKEGDISVAGPPRDTAGAMPAQGKTSDLVEVVRMLREENPGSSDAGLMKAAFMNALEIQKSAIMNNQISSAQLIELLKERNKPGDTPAWMSKVGDALLPAVVALFVKMLEPKDPLASITQVTQAMNAIKTASGGEAAAPDLLTSAINNAGPLFHGVANVLAELGKMNEARLRNAAMATPAAHGAPGAQPRAAIPAAEMPSSAQPAAAAAADPAQLTPDQIAANFVKMCFEDAGGAFAHDCLLQWDPENFKKLKDSRISFEDLDYAIRNGMINPLTVEMPKSPHYQKFLREFYDALIARAPAPPQVN